MPKGIFLLSINHEMPTNVIKNCRKMDIICANHWSEKYTGKEK